MAPSAIALILLQIGAACDRGHRLDGRDALFAAAVRSAQISPSVGHYLTRAKALPDHTHDGRHIVKRPVMSIIAGGCEVSQVEDKYLVALEFASIRLLRGIDTTKAGDIVRQGSGQPER